MMRLPEFDLLTPSSLPELTDLLARHDHGIRILAGGTDLIVNLKHGVIRTDRVVWLGNVAELKQIAFSSERGLRIGAMCTLSGIAASPIVRSSYPSLREAVLSVGSPAIRNRATLGGNLCLDTRCTFYNQTEFWRSALGGCLKAGPGHAADEGFCHSASGLSICSAVFCSDTAPLLIALEASVVLAGPAGARTIPLEELYRSDGAHHLALGAGEILTEILVPAPRAGLRSIQRKLRGRNAIDFPIVNTGIAMVAGPDGACTRIRIVLGALASTPLRVPPAEQVLEGRQPTPRLIEQAAAEASSLARPLPNRGTTVGYRKRMVKVLVERALTHMMQNA